MKLYFAAGVYVGTQADAKRLDKDFATVEVPTDKDGLMAFLNRPHMTALATASPRFEDHTAALVNWIEELHHSGDAGNLGIDTDPVITAARADLGTSPPAVEDDISDLLGDTEPPVPVVPMLPPMTGSNIVSAIDTPGIEQIVEVIATSKGQSLRCFAGAVAVRFQELAK